MWYYQFRIDLLFKMALRYFPDPASETKKCQDFLVNYQEDTVPIYLNQLVCFVFFFLSLFQVLNFFFLRFVLLYNVERNCRKNSQSTCHSIRRCLSSKEISFTLVDKEWIYQHLFITLVSSRYFFCWKYHRQYYPIYSLFSKWSWFDYLQYACYSW